MIRQEGTQYRSVLQKRIREQFIAKRNRITHIWLGMGVLGVIGWSVAVPCVIGVTIGYWMDQYYDKLYAWTISFLIISALFGVWNAWKWIGKRNARHLVHGQSHQ